MTGPFQGLRVVDLSEGIGGPLAAALFADYGAEVVKVEPPGGERLRHEPVFRVANRGKRGVVADLARPDDVDRLRALLVTADVAVVSGPDLREALGGLDPDELRQANPALVLTHVPMYGTEGPLARLPERESLLAAVSGLACQQITAEPGPAYFATPIVGYFHALMTANAVAAALVWREATGEGQVVEVSGVRACHAFELGAFIVPLDIEAYTPTSRALPPRLLFSTYGFFQAADGQWLFIGALTATQWVKLALAIGADDLLVDPRFLDGPIGVTAAEDVVELQLRVEGAIAAQPRAHWLDVLVAADLPVAPLNRRDDLFGDEQVRHLGLAVEVDDADVGPTLQMGLPVFFRGTPGAITTGAPPLDAGAPWPAWEPRPARERRPAPEGRGPLAGTVVLDLGAFVAGPFAATILADLGAEVVKVEPPTGDPWRPFALGFQGWNRGKQSVVLDLKKDEDRARFRPLLERADVLVHNLRGGIAERLGIDPAGLAAVSPRLVSVAVSAYGGSGPSVGLPAYDQVFQARSGSAHQQGGEGHDPVIYAIAPVDHSAAALAAFAAMAGLYARATTGEGQHAETSLLQASMVVGAGELVFYEGRPPQVMGEPDVRGRVAVEHAYPCTDGQWAFLHVANEAEWHAAAKVLGRPDLAERWPWDAAAAQPRAGELAAALADCFAGRSRDALVEALVEAGVGAAPCVDIGELFTHPHHAANCPAATFDDPTYGRLRLPGVFARLSATPVDVTTLAPALGEHTAALLPS